MWKRKILLLVLANTLFGQQYHEIFHDGLYRSYYLSLPENLEEPVPLIINMHGFGGSALSQIGSSEMDEYACPHKNTVGSRLLRGGELDDWAWGHFERGRDFLQTRLAVSSCFGRGRLWEQGACPTHLGTVVFDLHFQSQDLSCLNHVVLAPTLAIQFQVCNPRRPGRGPFPPPGVVHGIHTVSRLAIA